jgi:chitinase
MDYGDATPRNCVVSADVCQMGRSAVQAAYNLNRRHAVPLDRIELTPMIGINDVKTNVFTLDDAHAMARFVRDAGLAGVHYWSLDRDKPCRDGAAIVSSSCSGLAVHPEFAFARAFRDALGR